MLATVIALRLIVLQGLDGRDILISPDQVVRLSEAREASDPRKQFTGKVACVIFTTDGRYITVAEDCGTVRARLERP